MKLHRGLLLAHCCASLLLAASGGCLSPPPTPVRVSLSPTPTPAIAFRPAVDALVNRDALAERSAIASRQTGAIQLTSGAEEIPPPMQAATADVLGAKPNPIDLPTALRLVDAGNLQVAYAREQIRQALAREGRADVLWIPSVRFGAGFNNHEGAIQNIAGAQIDASRGAFYYGLGATDYGNGSPTLPGVYANFAMADAIFQPLAARQLAGARQQAAVAVVNDTSLRVALAYLELLRAHQEARVAAESRMLTAQLAELTWNYARTGEGLQSDADRMQAELNVRLDDASRAEEGIAVASARLAQLLRLDPATPLAPIEQHLAPIEMAPAQANLRELIAEGLTQRPEVAENRLLVGEASSRLRREEVAPLLPNVIVGVSDGDFGAGHGGALADFQGRFDFDAMAYWELRNFGFGDRAARNDVRSQMQQAQLRQFDVADQIAREVVEAYVQCESRRKQIANARQGVLAALDSHRRNLERIQAGKGLPIEALQSVQALAQARREYLRVVTDYNTAQFTLYRAMGSPAPISGG